MAKGDVAFAMAVATFVAKKIRSKQKVDLLLQKVPIAQRDPPVLAAREEPKPAAPKRKRRGTSTRGGQAKKRATVVSKKEKSDK